MTRERFEPENVMHMIEIARNEVALLVHERHVLNKRIKQLKRTVDCLATFLDVPITAHPHLTSFGHEPDQTSDDGFRRACGSGPRRQRNEKNKKLERACRIALLESGEGATAEQVYDRICRRRSYNVGRFKHPLAFIIATLETFVARDEAQVSLSEGSRRWQWNKAVKKIVNEVVFVPSAATSPYALGMESAPTGQLLPISIEPGVQHSHEQSPHEKNVESASFTSLR
jgi:hypothetical protein